MALSAVLEFGNNDVKRYTKRYLVSDCRFLFSRPYNGFSPSGAPRCERIELTIVAPGKDDLELVKWFAEQDVQSGRIVIGLPGDNNWESSDTQILYFDSAKCFSLSEVYDVDSSRRRLLKLATGPEHLEIDGITFKRA